MQPILSTFNHLRAAGRKALIPFLMGGDPDLATTRQLLVALEDSGADLLEVGIPFSDPLADGPVIQAASANALAQGVTPARVLELLASLRHRIKVPMVCLSYWNPILQFGHQGSRERPRAFVRAAVASGVSGVIVPDLPVEEGWRLEHTATPAGLATVFLAAPTSPPDRLRAIARASHGFIYYVSVTGTTGARRQLPPTVVHGVGQLKLLTTTPVCVGFGISTPRQASMVARVADGVIVGSALIQAIGRAKGRMAAHRAQQFLRRLRRAV